LLEFGTEEQKQRHLTVIAKGGLPGARAIVNQAPGPILQAFDAVLKIREIIS
jgi:alkylation response protein AidB-like acyl-CoA dehydrogenase